MAIKQRHNFRRVLSAFLGIVFIISSLYVPVFSSSVNSTPKPKINTLPYSDEAASNKIIVKYKDEKKSGFVKQSVGKKLKNVKINVEKKLRNIEVIGVSDQAECAFLMQELKNNPNVEYAQPDYKLKMYDIPTDDLFYKQWGLYNGGQTIGDQPGTTGMDTNTCSAWNYSEGNENVTVGVLDTGIDINHPELKDSIYVNKGEIPGNNKDDDQNGYIDDVNGWDFLNSDNTVFDNSTEDAHATHVAGIIAAKHNGQGVCGIAPGIRILPLKFLNEYDGYTSDAIEAIQYAEKMGVKVINCSWGDDNYNYALEQAMKNSGLLFVCASGNDAVNVDTTPHYPACFDIPNKITVAAIDNSGKLSDFSNYGTKVDIAAPGTDILSTTPGGKYDYADGTSMGAPFVTATAALIWSVDGTYDVQKVKDEIIDNVKKVDSLWGKVRTGGIVNTGFSVESACGKKPNLPTPTALASFTPTATPNTSGSEEDTVIDSIAEDSEIGPLEDLDYEGEELIPTPTPVPTPKPIPTPTPIPQLSGGGLQPPVILPPAGGVLLPTRTPTIPTITPTPTATCTPSSEPKETPISTPSPAATPYGNCIKGEVFIPGNTAQDDIKMQVYLENEKEKIYVTNVDINKGESSKKFTLYTLNGSSQDKYQIGYYIYDGGKSFCKNAYYTSYGSTFNEDYADNLTITQNMGGLKLDLLTKRKISGTVYLPSGMTAPAGGLEIKVMAGNEDTAQYTEYIKIPEGQKSASYEICVYENNSKYKYYIGYEINDVAGCMSEGYYNHAGTKYNFKDAEPIDISTTDAYNKNITLLRGKTVSGSVSLPDNRIAPEDAVMVIVCAESIDGNTSYTDIIGIEKGENSAGYSISLPYDSTSYYISYFTIEKGYVRNGYYNSGETMYTPESASSVSIPLQGASYIDLTLIIGGIISGKVNMPSGMVAPAGGVKVEVAAISVSNLDIYVSAEVTIKEKTSFADYTLTVPPKDSADYIIGAYTQQKGFVKMVFGIGDYNNSVYKSDGGIYPVSLDSVLDHSFDLVPGSEISGEISLPYVAPAGGLALKVCSVTVDGKGDIDDTFVIPQGLKKVRYLLTLPRNNSYYLGYELKQESTLYYEVGLYAVNQTVLDPRYANYLYLGDNNLDNINMQIIPKVVLPTPTSGGNDAVYYPNIPLPGGVGETTPTPTGTATPTPTQKPVASSTPVPTPSQSSVDPSKIPSDISKHWAREEVVKLIGRDFVSGYQDGTIKPDSDITRAEITKIIVKMLNLQPSQDSTLAFSDSQRIPDWARGYIRTVSDRGIIKGYDDKSFRPNNKLSRMEMAVIVLRALGYTDLPKTQVNFTDSKQIPQWAAGYVAKAVELGILKGYGDGSFKPDKNITRAEAFAVILRSMELKK